MRGYADLSSNTLDNADSYELELRDDGYVLDGKVKPFESRSKIIRIKNEQGNLIDREIEILSQCSAHSCVDERRDNDYRLGNPANCSACQPGRL